jgi:hypothetical protein
VGVSLGDLGEIVYGLPRVLVLAIAPPLDHVKCLALVFFFVHDGFHDVLRT